MRVQSNPNPLTHPHALDLVLLLCSYGEQRA